MGFKPRVHSFVFLKLPYSPHPARTVMQERNLEWFNCNKKYRPIRSYGFFYSLSASVDPRRSKTQLPTSPALQLATKQPDDIVNADLYGVQLPFLIGNQLVE